MISERATTFPKRENPLPHWPFFDTDEVEAVADVLRSGKVNYWTGTKGREFEQAMADYVGTKKGLAIMNGTVTLELALIALGIGPGDEVIITPRTFMATATAVMVRGATPIFADIDMDSGNISARTIEPLITSRTKAIIPVHLGGWPCEMVEMCELAKSHNISIIEDCAQAHGASLNGKMVGSFGHINSWSFCQDKIMTLGGEGGAITTDDEDAWRVMWEYKDHGKSYDAVYNRQHAPGFRWVNEGVGTNWRMTEMQAVLGLIQLKKLDSWIEKRQALASAIDETLKHNDMLRIPEIPSHVNHARYRWYGFLDTGSLKDGWDRDRICDEVTKLGYFCQTGSCSEIYLEKAFDAAYRPADRLANAKAIGESSICLATHPTLAIADAVEAAEALNFVLNLARK